MENLLAISVLVLLITFIVGMIKPPAVLRWIEEPTRGQVLLILGIPFIIFMAVVGNFLKAQDEKRKENAPAKVQSQITKSTEPSGMSSAEVARPTEAKQPSVVAKPPVKAPEAPVKVEEKSTTKIYKSFGIAPEKFRKTYNAKLDEFNIETNLYIPKFKVDKGETNDVFKFNITENIAGVGAVNKNDKMISFFNVFIAGNISKEDLVNFTIVLATVSHVLNPQFPKEKHQIIIEMLSEAFKNIEKGHVNTRKLGKYDYHIDASTQIGIIFMFSISDSEGK